MTRINHENHFVWQVQCLVKLQCHFSWQVQEREMLYFSIQNARGEREK